MIFCVFCLRLGCLDGFLCVGVRCMGEEDFFLFFCGKRSPSEYSSLSSSSSESRLLRDVDFDDDEDEEESEDEFSSDVSI